jgi:L-ascorbate metabolism protein UlaG (beta-lactamase superfamily)
MGVNDVIKNITWLGHDGFLIKGDGKAIVIDPFQVKESEPADIILVTHEHYDHCSPEDIKKIQKESTVIVTGSRLRLCRLTTQIRIFIPNKTLGWGLS